MCCNINGLTLCHKGSNGISHNTLPDVCKTPPFGVPVAYENEACSADLVKGTVSVFADNPSDECKIWTEVHFDKALELIYSGTQEGAPSARYYTPKGGRRMDIIQLNRDGKPRRLIDVKFPTDQDLTPDRARDYRKMAKKLDSEYDTFNVKKRCPGWPKTCPNEKPQEQPQTETQPEEKSASAAQYAILGGLVVVAVIASLCPFDGPAGDIVAWGAVSTQAESMTF
ncbi:hypothetical protein WDS27_000853 [Salmonella bongori]|nr:hypothetical protein [Salmonella bongori]EIT4620486.1 hypothetical protein [Salmonella bongori]